MLTVVSRKSLVESLANRRMAYALLLFLFCSSPAFAGRDWTADKIPEQLKKDASAVLRNMTTEIEVKSDTEIYERTRITITVLNEEGKAYGKLVLHYDNLKTVAIISGKMYDAEGWPAAKLDEKDVNDIGMLNISFFDDYRKKSHQFSSKEYPYTCVYETETRYRTIMSIPPWDPQPGQDCTVEKASLQITYPKTTRLKYQVFNMQREAVEIREDGENKVLRASIANVPVRAKRDGLSRNCTFPDPAIVINYDRLELGGVKGSMATWKDFGAFSYALNANRDELPEDKKKMVHTLTDSCTTAASKVAVLFEYLKRSTRYVNIVLGIGGWQTLEARQVAEKGYGDCKALTNYMHALLKEAGMPAYQALVWGGRHYYRDVTPDFPYNAFNHVILCVPLAKDTMWLECTSKDLPASYLSSFTYGRTALLITPEGGYLVNTPASKQEHNILRRKAEIAVDEKNEMTGNIYSYNKGDWWERAAPAMTGSKDDVKAMLNKTFLLPSYTIDNYKVALTLENGIPVIEEWMPIAAGGGISSGGQNLFLTPRVFRIGVESPLATVAHTDSFQLFMNSEICDTTIFTFAGTYTAEQLPKEINHDFPFASFHAKSYFENGNTLKVILHFTQKEGVYPPSFFADYLKMSKDINDGAAYSRVMLRKKQ